MKFNYNPNNVTKASDHRPLRWLVRQFVWNPYRQEQEEIITGYHNKLEQIPGMTSIYHQALSNIQRYGGEMWADYGDDNPVFVKRFV